MSTERITAIPVNYYKTRNGKHEVTNWRTVDWSLSDAELAVRYECAEHTVRTERSYWQRPVNGRGANDARSWPKPPETVDPVEFYRARCGV